MLCTDLCVKCLIAVFEPLNIKCHSILAVNNSVSIQLNSNEKYIFEGNVFATEFCFLLT